MPGDLRRHELPESGRTVAATIGVEKTGRNNKWFGVHGCVFVFGLLFSLLSDEKNLDQTK